VNPVRPEDTGHFACPWKEVKLLSRVLLIDDDAAFRHAMAKALRRKGVEVVQAADGLAGIAALSELEEPAPQVAVLDLRMPGVDGLEVLRRTPTRRIPVVVLTGHGTIPDTVTAMRLGAFSFLIKPVDAEELYGVLLQAVGPRNTSPVELIGDSPATRRLREVLNQLALAEDPVLLLGETGTGKEVAASYLHSRSHRASRPFVGVNVGGLPGELLESELFGHARGAFTGAERRKKGLFAEAEDGTLFLDEVAELPLEHQVKLLRVLETRRFRPLGEAREEPLRARLVAATNRNLLSAVRSGVFREDLYYRLQVLPVEIPPLRQRKEDIIPIAEHWLRLVARRPLRLAPEAREVFLAHDYPGNVRELVNVVRRVALFVNDDEVDAPLVRRMLTEDPFTMERLPNRGSSTNAAPEAGSPSELALSLRELERQHIERLLKEHRNITLVARLLDIDRRTLQRKLRSLDIECDWKE
jgi:DNA-binding NtrC family response regulator